MLVGYKCIMQTPESTKKLLPFILATAIFMQMLDSTILNTSLPAIAKDLNESPLNMQNAIISYVLTLAVFMPVSGFLSDKFGNTVNITPVLMVLLAGFLMLYFYYRHASSDENPIFPLNLFKVRTFRVGIIGNMATRLGISAIPLLLPMMIQIAYDRSAVTSGWIVAPMALTAMFAKIAMMGMNQ